MSSFGSKEFCAIQQAAQHPPVHPDAPSPTSTASENQDVEEIRGSSAAVWTTSMMTWPGYGLSSNTPTSTRETPKLRPFCSFAREGEVLSLVDNVTALLNPPSRRKTRLYTNRPIQDMSAPRLCSNVGCAIRSRANTPSSPSCSQPERVGGKRLKCNAAQTASQQQPLGTTHLPWHKPG